MSDMTLSKNSRCSLREALADGPEFFEECNAGGIPHEYCNTPKGRMIAISAAVPLLHQPSAEVRSGSSTQFLKCRAFQTVEVALAQRRLLKDMLRHFKRRDGLADQEASIRNNFVQRLPHDGDRRGIKFLFQIIHRSQPKSLDAS